MKTAEDIVRELYASVRTFPTKGAVRNALRDAGFRAGDDPEDAERWNDDDDRLIHRKAYSRERDRKRAFLTIDIRYANTYSWSAEG